MSEHAAYVIGEVEHLLSFNTWPPIIADRIMPKDISSGVTDKRRELTRADRVRILEAAAIHGIAWKVWQATGFPRWDVVAVAGCAGYGTPLFAQNLQALKEAS